MNSTLQWVTAFITITCLCILSYSFVDIQTALWFHSLEKNLVYELFEKITLFGDSLYYLLGGLLLFVVFRKKKISYGIFRAFSLLFCRVIRINRRPDQIYRRQSTTKTLFQ